MKQIELLSPVGDFECLKAAVQNGADSVYFGASNFNARSSATNFSLDTLKDAIEYAKLRNVNTHLTLNTLIKNEEFEDAIFIAEQAYKYGIDAIIVQDLGLAQYLIKNFPNLPIHASTQMTIHNLDGALEVQKLGFKRAVLSRELSLEEIEYICANTSIEIETFIHGALCISYSGQCLFSSMVGGRSGNRGKCAQPCRLPYELKAVSNSDVASTSNTSNASNTSSTSIDKGYLLSTRDLCGLEFLPNLIKAGVMCFKIEGRMKTPEYVAIVTKIYRKYIDLALSNEPYVIDEKDKKDLLQVFNRGGFSSGHLTSTSNKNLVYKNKSNHMGIYLGNVSNLKPNKGHVFLNLNDELSIGDTIMFEKENSRYTVSELMVKNKNIINANKKQFVEIGRMKGNINIGDKIYKIASKNLSNLAKYSYQGENKKVDIEANITIKKGLPITLVAKTLSTNNPIFKDISVSSTANISPVSAISKPISKDKVEMQISKTNNTIFDFKKINIDLDENLFVPSISVLNELRRNVLEQITNIAKGRISRENSNLDLTFMKNNKLDNIKNQPKISLLLNVLNADFKYEDLKNVDRIYIPLKFFANKKYINIIKRISDNFSMYIYIPAIETSNYFNILNNAIENSLDKYNIKGFVISNVAGGIFISKMKKQYGNKYDYIGNYTLNVYNNYTVKELNDIGIKTITISPELDKECINSLTNTFEAKYELIVYGNTPLMSTNYCFLGQTNRCYPTCGTRCQQENCKYYLKDRLGFLFRIIPDSIQTVTTIYNSKITSISGNEFNVDSYRIDIIDEDINQINNIIQTVIDGKRLEGKEYTNGNLNKVI